MPALSEADPRPTVLIVTEDGTEGARIRALLAAAGLGSVCVADREAAVNVLDASAMDVVVTRLRAPRIPGLQLLALARARNPEAGAILIIDPGEEETATRALERGVVDFQMRPLNHEKLAEAVFRLLRHQQAVTEIARLNRRLDDRFGFAGIVGSTGVIERMLSRMKEIAPLEANVLLIGETGTGKDLVAQVLHQNSPRRNGPFVKADCAALSARLLAQELFGIPEQGSRKRRRGRFALAGGGTLLLDAVAALPLDLQGRIAELLRTRQLRPGLDEPPVDIDVRLVAASDVEIEGLMESGQFHEGLHRILSAARIEVPPLRHRRRDVGSLARHFLGEFLGDRAAAVSISREALDTLESYDWPDNVRELREVIRDLTERLDPGGTIGVEELPEEIRERKARGDQLYFRPGTPLTEAERHLIEETIRLTRGNRERAAEMLGIGLRTLYRKLKSYKTDTA
jgi:two-component system response regulator HydG